MGIPQYSQEQVEELQTAIRRKYAEWDWGVPVHELPDFREDEHGIRLLTFRLNFSVSQGELWRPIDFKLLAKGLVQIVTDWERTIAGGNPFCVGYLKGRECPELLVRNGPVIIGQEPAYEGREFALRHIFGAVPYSARDK